MRSKIKIGRIIALVLIFLLSFQINCTADGTFGAEDVELGGALDTLPNEVKEALPDGLEEALSSPTKLADLFGPEYIFSLSEGLLKSALASAFKTFAFVAAIILISALVSSIAGAFSHSEASVRTVSLVGNLCIGSCAYLMIWSHAVGVLDFSRSVSSFMKALSAVFAAVCTGIGEVGSGASHGVWVFSLTAITEELCGKLLLPIMQISFASTLTSTAVSGVNVSRFVQMLRNAFTSLLIFFMTVISVILSFQTVVAHTSDSLAMRGVRYAVSHSVPIIGGLVSDSARTLATGFSLIKNSVGFFGIVIVIVLSLYPLVGLVTAKFALQLSSSFSSVLSEDKSCVFLDESVKMINFLIAVVIMLDVAFIFCLSVFALLPAAGA